MEDIKIGTEFNYYTYIGKENKKFLFKCVCGNIKGYKETSTIKIGRIKSCGCKRFKNIYKFYKGAIFSYLTLNGDSKKVGKKVYYYCKCKCGRDVLVRSDLLLSGDTKSCGCKRTEFLIRFNTKHSFTLTKNIIHPLYKVWQGMRDRCNNSKNQVAKYYYDKGIKVCDEWNDFINFYNWSLSNGWEKGLTIDRFPNQKGNYEPNNCRCVPMSIQCRNTSRNINITAFGETKCITDWSSDNRCKVSVRGLSDRIFKWKWEVERAITTDKMNKGGGSKKIK